MYALSIGWHPKFRYYMHVTGERNSFPFMLIVTVQKLSQAPEQSSNAGSFSVSGKLLPSYISLRTAEKILFVGESVHMFSARSSAVSSSRDVGTFAHMQPQNHSIGRFLGLPGFIRASRQCFDTVGWRQEGYLGCSVK